MKEILMYEMQTSNILIISIDYITNNQISLVFNFIDDGLFLRLDYMCQGHRRSSCFAILRLFIESENEDVELQSTP
jgi:hypothetical protein